MGIKLGELTFDSPRNVYYAGQILNGKVTFQLEDPFTLSALYVQFLGEASVDWTEEESESYNGQKRYKQVNYVGVEQYFNETQLLAGGNAPVNLTPGTHTYQFSYQIPPGVPSSFTGDKGCIKYGAKATIELNGKTVIEEYPKFFDVVAPFNLNKGSPKLKEPIELQFEEVYSGCLCGSGPVTAQLGLPVSGYCPGQVAPVQVRVDNRSGVEVTEIIMQILSRVRFRSQRPLSEYVPPETVHVTEKRGSVMANTERNFTVPLRMPELIAPNLESCNIIDLGFFFRVMIKMSGCNDDLEDEAEICLGLIPLNETLTGEYVHPLAADLPPGPVPDIQAIQAQLDQMTQRQPTQNQASYQVHMPQQNTQPQIGFNVPVQPIGGYPHPRLGPQQPYPGQVTNGGGYPGQVTNGGGYPGTTVGGYPGQGTTVGGYPGQGTTGSGYPTQSWDKPPFPQNHHNDLKIHLPPINMNVIAPSAPSAPPPSS